MLCSEISTYTFRHPGPSWEAIQLSKKAIWALVSGSSTNPSSAFINDIALILLLSLSHHLFIRWSYEHFTGS